MAIITGIGTYLYLLVLLNIPLVILFLLFVAGGDRSKGFMLFVKAYLVVSVFIGPAFGCGRVTAGVARDHKILQAVLGPSLMAAFFLACFYAVGFEMGPILWFAGLTIPSAYLGGLAGSKK